MQVDVKNREVTLRGSVDTRRQKRLAEAIAESVLGIRDIHNELEIDQSPARSSRSEQDAQSRQVPVEGPKKDSKPQASPGESAGGIKHLELLKAGLPVVETEGHQIGNVKEVRQNDFLLDRPMARDVYVPFTAVEATSDRGVMLNIRRAEIDRQGWTQSRLV
jgi:hypothetical protein